MKTTPLIEPLEARIAPAAYTWKGGSGDWNDQSIWRNDATFMSDGTFPNGTDDTVTFDGLVGPNLVNVPSGIFTVGKITSLSSGSTQIIGTGVLALNSVSGAGILDAQGGSLSIGVTLRLDDTGGHTFTVAAGASVAISGALAGSAPQAMMKTGPGTLTLSGTGANSNPSDLQLQGGKVVLSKTAGVTALPGSVTIANGATLETTAANVIADSTVVTLAGSGTLKLGGNEMINSFAGTGGLLDLGGHTVEIPGSSNYAGGFLSNGTIAGTPGDSFTLTGTDAAAHSIALTGGLAARISGSYAAVDFSTTAGGLEGEGTAGAFTGNGSYVAPLTSLGGPATLSVKSLGFTGTGVAYDFDIGDSSQDRIVVRSGGTVALGGSEGTLSMNFGATPALDQSFTLIDNQGSQPVSGTFKDVPEGTVFTFGGIDYELTYKGGDGNDVVLTSATAKATVSADGKTATFTDLDGDMVTIKSSTGGLTVDRIKLTQENAIGGASVRLLDFTNAVFAGSNITLTAKPAPRTGSLGDGFANVPRLDAGTNALGIVKIDGDLAEIDAGAVKALTVNSIGVGTTAVAESKLTSLGALTVKAGIDGATVQLTGAVGAVKIGGSARDFRLFAGTQIGAVKIGGDLESGFFFAGGILNPTAKQAVAIKSVSIGGDIVNGHIVAGWSDFSSPVNADVQVGAVKVKGDWITSRLLAGVTQGTDNSFGTADDALIGGGGNATIAKIASLTIGGQAYGSTDSRTYGIVAQQIGALKVGKAKAALTSGLDVLAIGFTGDFTAREIA